MNRGSYLDQKNVKNEMRIFGRVHGLDPSYMKIKAKELEYGSIKDLSKKSSEYRKALYLDILSHYRIDNEKNGERLRNKNRVRLGKKIGTYNDAWEGMVDNLYVREKGNITNFGQFLDGTNDLYESEKAFVDDMRWYFGPQLVMDKKGIAGGVRGALVEKVKPLPRWLKILFTIGAIGAFSGTMANPAFAEDSQPVHPSDYQQVEAEIDGSNVLITELNSGNYDVIWKNLTSGNKQDLFPEGKYSAMPALKGDMAVFEGDIDPDLSDGDEDIFLRYISTWELKRLTSDITAQSYPATDGVKYVAWQHLEGLDHWDIYGWNKSTDQIFPIANTDFDETRPTLSPDGHAAWMAKDITNVWQIWTKNLETGETTQITDGSTNQKYPHMSKNYIVWQGMDPITSNWDIFAYDKSTKQIIRITNDDDTQQYPHVDDEGNVVFQDDGNSDYDIFMRKITTLEETQITYNGKSQKMPKKSGEKIIWLDYRVDPVQVYWNQGIIPPAEEEVAPVVSNITLVDDTLSADVYDENADIDGVYYEIYKKDNGDYSKYITDGTMEPDDYLYDEKEEDVSAKISSLEKGEYRIGVTAIDDKGMTNTDFLYITIPDENGKIDNNEDDYQQYGFPWWIIALLIGGTGGGIAGAKAVSDYRKKKRLLNNKPPTNNV